MQSSTSHMTVVLYSHMTVVPYGHMTVVPYGHMQTGEYHQWANIVLGQYSGCNPTVASANQIAVWIPVTTMWTGPLFDRMWADLS